MFDVTLFQRLSKLAIIRNVAKLYDGTFVKLPQIKTFRGKSVIVESFPEIKLETDGESLGNGPFEFEIIPKAICLIVE